MILPSVTLLGFRTLGKQKQVTAVKMFQEFKNATGVQSLFPSMSPHMVPTAHPESSLHLEEPRIAVVPSLDAKPQGLSEDLGGALPSDIPSVSRPALITSSEVPHSLS